MSEIVFLPNCRAVYSYTFGVIEHSYTAAYEKVCNLVSFSTSQMAMLMEQEIKRYDSILIVNGLTDQCVIRNNHDGTWDCDRTERELRDAHNFYRLWSSGEFDLPDTEGGS